MRYEYIKIVIFWTLVSTLPGIIFIIQVVLIMPANMMFAYAVVGLWKHGPGGFGVGLFYMAFFLTSIGLWALLAIPISKFICLAQHPVTRNLILLVVAAVLFVLPFLPIYGSGGHGAGRRVSLADLDDARLEYWLHVFPPTVLICLLSLWHRHKKIQKALAD